MKKIHVLLTVIAFMFAIGSAFSSLMPERQLGWWDSNGALPDGGIELPIFLPVNTELVPCSVQPGIMCKAKTPPTPFKFIVNVYDSKANAESGSDIGLLKYN